VLCGNSVVSVITCGQLLQIFDCSVGHVFDLGVIVISEQRILILQLLHMGHMVAQLVEAVCCKSEGRGFDSQWHQWNFSLT